MKTDTKTKALRPATVGAAKRLNLPTPDNESGSWWQIGEIRICSVLVDCLPPDDSPDPIPTWYLSATAAGQDGRLARLTGDQVSTVVEAFGLDGYEIDNHHSGNGTHFFVPKDPARRTDCECKSTEAVVTEADGYAWTNPVNGPCRGCELPIRPCPIHSPDHVGPRPSITAPRQVLEGVGS